MRVLAAVSGGVDSAVAMARAVVAGHDVTAVHMALSKLPETGGAASRGCCSLADRHDAKRAADILGVPFYVWDLSSDFTDLVIEDFRAEYAAGRTPNPCVRCNEHIKFATLLQRGIALDFDAVVTGHYARIIGGTDGPQLHRAVDDRKDQSYVLAVLGPQQLRHCMFPLGDTTKDAVRAEAQGRGLGVANKPDSHDICFIPDGDTAGWLRRHLGDRPGDIVDAGNGDVVGQHHGTHTVTVGQRRGLGITQSAPDRQPRYVVEVEPTSNTIFVGAESLLSVDTVEGVDATWTAEGPLLESGRALSLQFRAHGAAYPAEVEREGGRVVARMAAPMRAVAAGQSMVVYDGQRVLGQATVDRSLRSVVAHRYEDREIRSSTPVAGS